MSTANRAHAAYGPAATSIRTDRANEYDAFAKITGALKSARDTRDRAAAIADNRQLWTLLAVDAANEANALPRDLRGQIVQLAEFTDRHSSKVLRGEADLAVLIEINAAIMAGLRSSGAAA